MARGIFKVNGGGKSGTILNAEKQIITLPFDVEKGDIIWRRPDLYEDEFFNNCMLDSSYGSFNEYMSGRSGLKYDSEPESTWRGVNAVLKFDFQFKLFNAGSNYYDEDGQRGGYASISPLSNFCVITGGTYDSPKDTLGVLEKNPAGNILSIVPKGSLPSGGYRKWSADDSKLLVASGNSGYYRLFGSLIDTSEKKVLKTLSFNSKYNGSYVHNFDLSKDGELLIIPNISGVNRSFPYIMSWNQESMEFVEQNHQDLFEQEFENSYCIGIKISIDKKVIVFLNNDNVDSNKKYLYIYEWRDYKYYLKQSVDLNASINYNVNDITKLIYIHPSNNHILYISNKPNELVQLTLDKDSNLYELYTSYTQKSSIFYGQSFYSISASYKYNDKIFLGFSQPILYDLDEDNLLVPITPFSSALYSGITDISHSPCGKYIALTTMKSNEGLHIYKYNEKHKDYTDLVELSHPAGICYCCDFSNDGKYIAVGTNISPFLTIYRIQDEQFKKLVSPTAKSTINRLKFTAENRIICSNMDWFKQSSANVFIKGAEIVRTANHSVTRVLTTKDGNTLLFSLYNQGYIDRYDFDGNTYVQNVTDRPQNFNNALVYGMAFNEDESILYVTGSNKLYGFSFDTVTFANAPLELIPGNTGNVNILNGGGYDLFYKSDTKQLIIFRSGGGSTVNPLYSGNSFLVLNQKDSDGLVFEEAFFQPWDRYSFISVPYNGYGNSVYTSPNGDIYACGKNLLRLKLNKSFSKNNFEPNEVISNQHKLYVSSKKVLKNEEIEMYELNIKN